MEFHSKDEKNSNCNIQKNNKKNAAGVAEVQDDETQAVRR